MREKSIVDDLRERARDQRLREAREVLDQDVAVGEQAEQDELERVALADDGPLDLVEHPIATRGDVGDGQHLRSAPAG